MVEESLRLLCHSGDLGDFLIYRNYEYHNGYVQTENDDEPADFVAKTEMFFQGNFANAWSLDADPKKWEYYEITKKFGPFDMFNLWPHVEQRKLIVAKNILKKKNTTP